MFTEIDFSLPNLYGSSSQNIPSASSSDLSQQSYSSQNFNWRYYSIDSFLGNLSIMPAFTYNDTTVFNSTISTNISSNSQENSSADDEASDHLLYLIIPLYSLVFVIGTIGNILVILTVVTVKQMRNTTNALILHLANANLAFVLMCIPHTIYAYVVPSYNFPKLLCKLANTLMYLSAYVSIYILVLMSVDRFLGVVFAVKSTKYRTERNAHLAVIVVWLVGIIVASPNMMYYDVLAPSSPDIWFCLPRAASPIINTARYVSVYCFAILGLIIPLIIIAILYGLIINVLRQNATGKQVAKGKKRVTKMVSAVISSFVICWTPMQIYILYTHHNPVTSDNAVFAIVAQCLVYISSCVNPILYAFLSEPFRKAFKQFLTCSKLLSTRFLTNNEIESTAGPKSSSYRVIQQQSKAAPTVLNNDVKMKKKFTNNHHYRMSDLNSEAVTTTNTSEPIKYNRLSDTCNYNNN